MGVSKPTEMTILEFVTGRVASSLIRKLNNL